MNHRANGTRANDHKSKYHEILLCALKENEKRLEEEAKTYPYEILSSGEGHQLARSYYVYVVELAPDVRSKKATNEGCNIMPCLYVGMAGISPEERFERHKDNIQAGKGYVRDYGLLLIPEPYDSYNLIDSSDRALEVEAALAEKLRRLGYTVYGGD